MKKLIIVCLLAVCGIAGYAQEKKNHRFSPEEFKARQEAFITEQAGLSPEEAARFFPVYFELQNKKKEINDKAWKQFRKGKEAGVTEAQYDEITALMLNSRIETDVLEKSYYQQFRKILSAKKLYQVQHAAMKFHRELLKEVKKKEDKNGKP